MLLMIMEFKRFKMVLRSHNNFVTKPRMRLFGVLQHHPALTIKQLIQLVPKHDQATIYRNVDLFERLGIISRLRLGWHTKIELSDVFRHHHHHMSCIRCGKVWVLKEDALLEQQLRELTATKRFKALDHQLEIRGYCRACQAKNRI